MYGLFSLVLQHLLIWIFALEIICGIIIFLTKIRPTWFRVLLAAVYAALPSTISILTQSVLVGYITIALELLILLYLLFKKSDLEKAFLKRQKFSSIKKMS